MVIMTSLTTTTTTPFTESTLLMTTDDVNDFMTTEGLDDLFTYDDVKWRLWHNDLMAMLEEFGPSGAISGPWHHQFEAPRCSDDHWFGLRETRTGNPWVFFNVLRCFSTGIPRNSTQLRTADLPVSHDAVLPIADVLPCSCNHDVHTGVQLQVQSSQFI